MRGRVQNGDISEIMNIDTTIISTGEAKSLRWYGHVWHMNNYTWPKTMIKCVYRKEIRVRISVIKGVYQ